MEAYLPIAYLNDFIFCPRSIYFHQLYGRAEQRLYQSTYQTEGKAAHKTVDQKRYSTAKTILQSLDIYSEEYMLGGKIDTYDQTKSLLVERKKKIKVIYDGYIFQLYAQYHCLKEMGYKVNKLKLYSMDDNKSYPINKPEDDLELQTKFEQLIQEMRNFDLDMPFTPNPNKCKNCIYSNLCDKALC